MEEVKQKLEATILQVYGVKTDVVVTVAPEDTGADFASNVAMQLAKLVHKAPVAIANELKDAFLADAEANGMAWRVEIAGPGFMNFISPDEYFYEKVADFAENQENLIKNISAASSRFSDGASKNEDNSVFARLLRDSWGEYDGKTVVCEFSDPNPFKVLHVGHLYTSMVGDSISRILEMAGAKVVRANFGGDVGLHVGKTIWALLQQLPNHLTIEEIAKAYVEGTRAYEEDERAKAEITEINRMVYEIALQEFGDIQEWPGHEMGDDQEGVASALDKEEIKTIYLKGRELSYKYFEDFYARVGVKFDRYYPESTVAVRGLCEVRQGLDRGVYEESNGAVVYKGEKFGLHTRVFINQNGLPTYEAKDVGLVFTKWDDYHFDESVVITGNDIIEYMKVVLASVSEMAPKLSERTRHLTHGQVKLPGNEKMSSRKGNFLKAVDVIEMVAQELAESTGQPADEKVVLAALRYAFLKYKMGGDIIFDPKESVAMTGNSGVYLLYSTVRAKKVLRRISGSVLPTRDTGVRDLFKDASSHSPNRDSISRGNAATANPETPFVRKLSKKIVQYQDVLKEAVAEKAPNKICAYLFELAQEFSRFYENVKVIGNENEAELIVVVQAYANVMEHGLGLLGIEVPEEM